jgi:hypothetical protein
MEYGWSKLWAKQSAILPQFQALYGIQTEMGFSFFDIKKPAQFYVRNSLISTHDEIGF